MSLPHEPLFDGVASRINRSLEHGTDIPSCASGELPEDGPRGCYSLAWSAWRASDSKLAHRLLHGHPTISAGPEPMVCGVQKMECEWSKNATLEHEAAQILRYCAPPILCRIVAS